MHVFHISSIHIPNLGNAIFIQLKKIHILCFSFSQTADWINGWTEEKARNECEKHILNTDFGSQCQKLGNVDTTGPVESCIMDIKVFNT